MCVSTASPSAVNLTAASCSKKTPIAWKTSPTRSGYSRPVRKREETLRPVGPVAAHERVAVVGRRDEGLLDRAGSDPANQVPHRAGFVVRAGCAGASERLLPDDGAGGLVIDVEVARGVAQLLMRLLDGEAVVGED